MDKTIEWYAIKPQSNIGQDYVLVWDKFIELYGIKPQISMGQDHEQYEIKP